MNKRQAEAQRSKLIRAEAVEAYHLQARGIGLGYPFVSSIFHSPPFFRCM